MELVYKTEKPLFVLSMTIGIIVWLAIIVGTFGIALIYVLLFLLICRYRFRESRPQLILKTPYGSSGEGETQGSFDSAD